MALQAVNKNDAVFSIIWSAYEALGDVLCDGVLWVVEDDEAIFPNDRIRFRSRWLDCLRLVPN